MNIFIILLIFLLFSCNYPDIDSVPNFYIKQTIQEKCNFINQILPEDLEECILYKKEMQIITSRL